MGAQRAEILSARVTVPARTQLRDVFSRRFAAAAVRPA